MNKIKLKLSPFLQCKTRCPECKELVYMHYDSFEDMYRCDKCWVFLYPEELNLANNLKAGVWN